MILRLKIFSVELQKITFKKVWLALTFFPIEDDAELTQLRALLSPFMNNVRKCTEFNGDYRDTAGKDDIINTASSAVDQELIDRLGRVMIRTDNGTLNLEHDRLRANIR